MHILVLVHTDCRIVIDHKQSLVLSLSLEMELTLPSSVELRVFPTEGRGLVAKERFAPGDMLLCTKPYVHVVGAEAVEGFCGKCVKRL